MLKPQSYPPPGRTRERLAAASRRAPRGKGLDSTPFPHEHRRARYGIRSYPRSCWPRWYVEAYCPVHDGIACGCSK